MRKHSIVVAVLIGTFVVSALSITLRGVEPEGSPAPSKRAGRSEKITPACRKSIDKGMAWLISAMRRDGSVGTDVGQRPDLACTAMLGLALLSEGNTTTGGPHCKELRRVLDAVLNMLERRIDPQDASNTQTLIQRKIGQNADVFLSALFLSQVLGEAPGYEKEGRVALESLVSHICRTQNKDGMWGEDSWAPILGTVLGWESLRASSSAGFKVDASSKLAGEALLSKLRSQSGANQQSWMHNFYKHASSIRVLYSLNYRDDPTFKQCIELILKVAHEDGRHFEQAGGEEFLAFYFVTECLLKEPQDSWKTWYPTVRDKMIHVQNHDGSWSGHHCITARTFCTAAALMTLQSQNLYLPISDL